MPLHVIDTAGLRDAADEVERIGVERTWAAVRSARSDHVHRRRRATRRTRTAGLQGRLPEGVPMARVVNKIDLSGARPGRSDSADGTMLHISARTGAGIAELRAWLLEVAGWLPHGEGLFMARERHLVALREAAATSTAAAGQQAFELKAEDLRLAQAALGRITGEVSADDLLGEIFGRFCIGK